MKGGEIMRAIDIMFAEIDRLNTEIKAEENMYNKLSMALQIKKIVEIIYSIEKLRIQSGDNEWS